MELWDREDVRVWRRKNGMVCRTEGVMVWRNEREEEEGGERGVQWNE